MSVLCPMGWLHDHEFPWNIIVKLERINVKISVGSILRNGKNTKTFPSLLNLQQSCPQQ